MKVLYLVLLMLICNLGSGCKVIEPKGDLIILPTVTPTPVKNLLATVTPTPANLIPTVTPTPQ